MAGISSRIGTIAMAKQTAKGTPAAAPTVKWFLSGSPSLGPVKERGRFAMTDSSRDLGGSYTSALRVEGDIPVYAHFDGMALPFYAALGANADSGTNPNYTHTATPASDTPWLTVWRMVGNVVLEKYVDCKMTSLSLEGSAGSPITMSMGIVGISSEFLASDTVLAPLTSAPYIFPELQGRVLIDTVAQRIHRLSWSINNNHSGYQADDYFFSDVDPGGREFEFSFATRFTGPTAFPKYREFFYGSDAGTTLSPTVGNHDVSFEFLRNANASFKVSHPAVTYQPFQVQPDPGGDPLEVEVACAIERPSSGSICTAVSKDQTATV